ncbi:hypothetical protein ZWY2020_032515 [Hordeum vulgare]|nr:hypothetical protein ZWY2020_032515 [Hordeum vulgare]
MRVASIAVPVPPRRDLAAPAPSAGSGNLVLRVFTVTCLLCALGPNYGFLQMMAKGFLAKSDNAGTKKSPLQIQMLETFYSEVQYPKPEGVTEYAASVGLTHNQVRIWFKERRRKEKRHMEAAAVHMETQASARSNWPRCSSSRSSNSSQSPMQDTTGHHSYQDQSILKKRKIMAPAAQKSSLPFEDNNPVRKHGKGKGLMTVWHAMYSQTAEIQDCSSFIDESGCLRSLRPFEDCGGKLAQKQTLPWKKVNKKSRPPPSKRKVPCGRVTDLKEHPPVECHLSATLVDDEELELSELQAGPNPLRCSAHLSSTGRHGCPLCKDLLARFPPPSVRMKQPFPTKPWESSPKMVKKLFQVVRFVYTHFGSIDVHPFTFDEFAQAFHDKDSSLLGKVHVSLLKLLMLNTERGSGNVFVPRSSKDSRFLSFLNFVREQEFDVNFWMKSLNSLTWVEILRQVLVASGFGSDHHMLNRNFFSKEKNQMVKYGLCPRTLKGELFALLSEKGSGGLKVAELAKSSQIIGLNLSGASEVEQLIFSTLSSDITLFEKIAPSAYRLRVDPRIKGKEDPRSDTEDSGTVDDDEDASSSGDESDGPQESYPEHESRIVRWRQKSIHKNVNKCSEIDESYSGERWLLGLMEGEYSDLSIDEKLDCLVALIDVVSGAGSVPRLEEPQSVLSNIQRAQSHASGGKIKKCTRAIYQSSDEYFNRPGSPHSFDSSMQGQSGSLRSQDYIGDSGANESSTGFAHQPQIVLLGSDRRYNNYWLFLGPCRADDPGHHRVYFESSEDGRWEVIDSPQDLLSLLSVLDIRGMREAHLLASMRKRQSCLFEGMKKHLEDGEPEGLYDVPNHKVLPSQLQALKAAIHAIEACMPTAAFAGLWMKSSHNLWVKRLRRTSSLPELLQVLVDFVGAIDEDWLYQSSSAVSFSSYLDDITVYFQTMPQTTSAVALWVVKLDALIAPHLAGRGLGKGFIQTKATTSP